MRIVISTNNPVRLSFLVSLLEDAGIESVVLNQHTSATYGGIGAMAPQVAVADADYGRACRVMRDAGES